MKSNFYLPALAAMMIWQAGAPAWAGTNFYVVPPGTAGVTPTYPHTNWATASTDLVAIADRASVDGAGNSIAVSNGTYYLTNQVTLQYTVMTSLNGAAQTVLTRAAGTSNRIIEGVSNVIDSFTISNGYHSSVGGGFYLHNSVTARNCIVVGNVALSTGGGAYLVNNITLYNCLFANNRTEFFDGGGVYLERSTGDPCKLINCTIVSNTAGDEGGGVYAEVNMLNSIENSIIYGNQAASCSNVAGTNNIVFTNCCLAPITGLRGSGNISSNPSFAGMAGGNYRLAAGSPCIDKGTNQSWMTGATDLDGNSRIINSIVDMGAYEYNSGSDTNPIQTTVTGYDFNGIVQNLTWLPDNKVIVVGDFSTINGVARDSICRLNTDGSLDSSWGPTNVAGGRITDVACDGTNLYVSGDFTNIDGVACSRFAKLDANTGVPDTTFTNGVGDGESVTSMLLTNNALYIGGIFRTIRGERRVNLAKLNASDGQLDSSFAPEADNEVMAIVYNQNALYVGGYFEEIEGYSKYGLAKLNPTNGAVDTAFTNYLTSSGTPMVRSMVCFSNSLYIGGNFTALRDSSRTNIAKLNLTNGATDTGYTKGVDNANHAVRTLTASDDSIFAAGYFTNIGGINHKLLAKLNPTDGSIDTAFTNEIIGCDVKTLAFRTINDTNYLYVGGDMWSGSGYLYNLQLIRWQAGSSTSSPSAPSAPTGVSASDGTYTDKVRVTWNASSGATGYQIWRNTSATTNTAGQLDTTASTIHDDTTATAGTTYYYWLKATNSVGASSFSSYDSGYRRIPTPGEVAFSASSYSVYENAGSVTLTVTRSSGSDGAASVNYATANGTAIAGTDYTSASGTLSWSVGDSSSKTIAITIINRSGQQDNRAFTVGLSGASGVSLASPYSATVTIQDVWPSAPTGVIASDGTYADKILVYWTSVASATSYKIWRGTDNNAQNASVIGTSTMSFYLDTAVTAGTVYYYWIQGVNSAGTSELSASDSGYCGSIANPAIPAGISATDGTFTDYIKVVWQAGNGATQYEVWRALENNLSSASLITETTGISCNDSSVSQGVYYYYWVRARNANNRCSGYSTPDSGWCRLNSPAGVSAGNGLYPYHINVAWNAVANAVWYEVWREEVPGENSNGGNLLKAAQTSETYFNDYYTRSGVYYRYKIKACNGLCSSLDYGHDTGIRQVPAASTSLPVLNDYDGDQLSDLALFNSSSGALDVLCSALGRQTFSLGAGRSQGATGDYDGDQLADPVSYCPDMGAWLARLSTINYNPIIQANFGGRGNVAAAADYDGDGRADLGVYNETNGVLAVLLSNHGAFNVNVSAVLGGPGYSFVPADFDGDGRADPALYSETESQLIVMLSKSGYYRVDLSIGGPGQSMYSADFDGDAKADPVLYEEASGQWTVLLSSIGYWQAKLLLGGPGYAPAIADYDGDGRADPAVYRETDGQWLIMLSGNGYAVITETFGG